MYTYRKIPNLKYTLLYASLNTALSPKTAANSIGHKIGHSSTKTQHPWYHSVDTRHYSVHVKFEEWFVISFSRDSITNKK
jgi:hypothetical protein